jgi:glycerate dehydrogenase
MPEYTWQIHNPDGTHRVIVTKALPGRQWRDVLTAADCRIEVCQHPALMDTAEIEAAIGNRCEAAIGQLTESWGKTLFSKLHSAGGKVYSNYAVGYNNVDLDAATRLGIPVGNTPGVLTETTAEMAVALTFATARRMGEAERFLRAGRYTGWLPDLFLGTLLHGKTLGVIGAGRIGSTYARMMIQGHDMHVIYHNRTVNPALESFVADYNRFRASRQQPPLTCRFAKAVEPLLEAADCVSIHTVLDKTTRHLIDARRLARMKPDAILINTSRGPVVDEAALVNHCRSNPDFRAGLDVFEKEPVLAPGLAKLENVVIVPHIASATRWTREGMATLAACNVAGILCGYPLWNQPDTLPFVHDDPPQAVPSIVNARELGLLP